MSSSAYQRSTDVGHDAAILVGMHDPHEDDPDVRRFNRGIGGTGARKMLGILTLVTAVVAVTAALTWYGLSLHDRTQSTLASSPLDNDTGEKSQGVIQDSTDLDLGYDDDIGDDDDTKSNPEVYPDRKCRQLSWSVQNNLIHDGSKAIPIKGISWYGMELEAGVPLGLWDGARSGSTIYQIGKYLASRKFNSVRLPLSIESLSRANVRPDASLINLSSNKALDVTSYMTLLSSIIQGLGVHNISVLLDFHTLTPGDVGDLWTNSNSVGDAEVRKAIRAITSTVCNSRHWNVMGLELKNAPNAATWDDGSVTDWKVAVETYGNLMLSQCPEWLVFVDGWSAKRVTTIEGREQTYRDWDGGGLQDVGSSLPQLNVPHKVVWTPHYYSSSKKPQAFFYQSGQVSGDVITNVEEYNNATLERVVRQTMTEMFGYLVQGQPSQAIVLAAFGGLYADEDLHPLLTSHRTLEYVVKTLADPSQHYAGGYAWALNPGTFWGYNPSSARVNVGAGLFADGEGKAWRVTRSPMLRVLSLLDDMPGLEQYTCRVQE